MWREMRPDIQGPTHHISQMMKKANDDNRLPTFESNRYIIFSDYSGQHNKSRYQAYSFLLVDRNTVDEYHYQAKLYRMRHVGHKRKISHKDLRDTVKLHAARELVRIANKLLHGILVTVAVDGKLATLINGNRIEYQEGMDPNMVDAWNSLSPQTAEQTARTVHFISLIISGVLPENSEVTWITDRDEIANSKHRKSALYDVFKSISSRYLQCNMGGLWLGDSDIGKDTKIVEDILCIPDLAAGSFCRCLNDGLVSVAKSKLYLPSTIINQRSLSVLHLFRSPPDLRYASFFFVLNSSSKNPIDSFEYLIPTM